MVKNMICSKCKIDSEVVLCGRTTIGSQRYKCKNCGAVFSKRETLDNTEKRMLSMLLSFLELEPDKDLSLKEFCKNAKNCSIDLKNIKIKSFHQRHSEPLKFAANSIQMIISKDDNEITLIKFKQPVYNDEQIKIFNAAQSEFDEPTTIIRTLENKYKNRHYCKDLGMYCSNYSQHKKGEDGKN